MSDENQIGDGPIEEGLILQMNAVAHGLDMIFNGDNKGTDRKIGFVLLVFPFGDDSGRCNYISNGARRSDIVALMREQIQRFEETGDA